MRPKTALSIASLVLVALLAAGSALAVATRSPAAAAIRARSAGPAAPQQEPEIEVWFVEGCGGTFGIGDELHLQYRSNVTDWADIRRMPDEELFVRDLLAAGVTYEIVGPVTGPPGQWWILGRLLTSGAEGTCPYTTTARATAVASPTSTASASPSASSTASQTASPTTSTVASPTAGSTASPTTSPTATPSPTARPSPMATLSPAATPSPLPAASSTMDASPAPTDAATPTPTGGLPGTVWLPYCASRVAARRIAGPAEPG
ncbi:MAG: hypothetical protein ACK2T6_06090 [Anaerolineae bacterium]